MQHLAGIKLTDFFSSNEECVVTVLKLKEPNYNESSKKIFQIHKTIVKQSLKFAGQVINPISHKLWYDVITRGGPLWPGWIVAILKLSLDILGPKIDFHPILLIFGCP